MIVGSPYVEQVRAQSGAFVADMLKRLEVAITTSFHKQHNQDDSHSTIRATGAIYERNRTAAIGEFIIPPFAPAQYTADVGTWVPTAAQVKDYSYELRGMIATVSADIEGSTITGANTVLMTQIPATMVAARQQKAPCVMIDNGVVILGIMYVLAGGRIVNFIRFDSAGLTASANTGVIGQLQFEVRVT